MIGKESQNTLFVITLSISFFIYSDDTRKYGILIVGGRRKNNEKGRFEQIICVK
ncbi:hypothetical protein BH18THE2_BH18THE2_09920 [soil metagenome]